MSQVYVLEPPTQGKVVLRTTLGDLDVELWPKEAPKAARNFVQLCTEGYYDGTVFHRMIKDFMIQGGDPTGTGDGGESIYGQPFKDEFHTRLKFNHRGLVACANQNKADTNGSQFFVTLDRADHCNKQYTIFGKITGDTIYNLSRFNELETEDDDRPAHPPVLTRADVLWNPFDDLKPRVDRDAREAEKAAKEAAAAEAKKQTRKQAKNFALMSFGEEAEEEDAEAAEAAAHLKIRSAHDVLEDERLAKEPAVEVDLDRLREATRAAKAAQKQQEQAAGDAAGAGDDAAGGDFGSHMLQKMHAKRRAMGLEPAEQGQGCGAAAAAAGGQRKGEQAEEEELLDYGESDGEAGAGGAGGSDDEDDDGQGSRKRSRLADQGRGRKSAAAVVVPSKQIKVADSELLTDWERKRQEYKQRKRLGGSREKATLQRLGQFKQQLKTKAPPAGQAPPAGEEPGRQQQGQQPAAAEAQQQQQGAPAEEAGYAGKVRDDIDHRAYMPAAWRVDDYLDAAGEEEDDDLDLSSLRKHTLAFAKNKGDAMSRSDNPDDYTVFDPLLEAGKAKFSKQQQRAKKRGSEWAGRAQG